MFLKSLSGRFLLLTILFVMLAEILIFVPSVARFRYEYLHERLERSQIASLAVLVAPNDIMHKALELELLKNAEVLNIVLQRDESRQLVLSSPIHAMVDKSFDLRKKYAWMLIRDAFDTLWNGQDRIIRVIGVPVKGAGELIEITMYEKLLYDAIIDYGKNILWLSFVISIITSALLFGAVRRFMVRPINRVIQQIKQFESAPEDSRKIIKPEARVRELYEAELALQSMETQIHQSLHEKKRLVALGEAVSKISHDLRNILTTTQLLADRMENSNDPSVQKIAPKLLGSLGRAVTLCDKTLRYGKAEEPVPLLEEFSLYNLIKDVVEAERLFIDGQDISINYKLKKTMKLLADEGQIYRVISNLIRNSCQVLSGIKKRGSVMVLGSETSKNWIISVSDDGPGLPVKALKNLFLPFHGGVRSGGVGLGLAISAELIDGHGGTLKLEKNTKNGACFIIKLPKP